MKKFLRCAITTVVLAVLLVSQASAFNYWDSGYVLAADKKSRMAMPRPYTCEAAYSEFEGASVTTLNDPQDLFVSESGDYYVADKGNGRILRLNANFEFVAEYTGDGNLMSPEGIYVSADGDMYVADSAAGMIAHLDADGAFVEKFVMPESDLLYDVKTFTPLKVALNPVNNYLYVIQGKQFMTIDAANNFKGYIGTNKVGFDILNYIIRTFATDEQKDKMKKIEPDAYHNFCVANGGKIYATSAVEDSRISVINTVGNNTYPSGTYGETLYDNAGVKTNPEFADICVDENEIVSVIERNTRCIYQYDPDGNLLCIFGGEGDTVGYFNVPVSMVYDKGNLVTLDSALKRIQVFKPTDFINTVHKAVIDYADGNYERSLDEWNEVKASHASYGLAREFIGKIKMKQGQFSEVLADFKQSEDKQNYGKAFEKLRYLFLQKYFYYVVAAIIVIFVVVVLAFKRFNKWVRKVMKEFWDILEG